MAVDSFACLKSAQKFEDCSCIACEDIALYGELKALYGDRVYAPYSFIASESGANRLYVPSLDLPDKALDTLIDYVLSSDTLLAVVCSRTLTEAGRIDSRFNKSPVMLLHEFGLLERSTAVSGVYLDKDDLSLMAQENIPLVVLPSSDAGGGFGVAPITAALERGVRVKVGSGDGAFNPRRSVLYEASALGLLVSCQMNKQNAVSEIDLAKMCLPDAAQDKLIEETARKIHDKIFD